MGSSDIHLFVDQVKPHIEDLYPGVKSIEYVNHFVRRGSGVLDQPV